MSTFALKNINGLSKEAQEVFKQLEIKRSETDDKGECQLDEFEKLVERTTFKSEFKKFIAYLNHWAQDRHGKAPKIFKDITPKKTKETEHEFKPDNTRIYMALIDGKRIVFYGNLKKPSTQDNHIEHFRNLKKQYITQISNGKK
jgi:hypothetical protein